jgi:hypothetical protein
MRRWKLTPLVNTHILLSVQLVLLAAHLFRELLAIRTFFYVTVDEPMLVGSLGNIALILHEKVILKGHDASQR